MSLELAYLRRTNKTLPITQEGGYSATLSQVATVARNLEKYGYTLSPELFAHLMQTNDSGLINWYIKVRMNLDEMLGTKASKKPMYPNFPKQVMEASAAELYVNALVHYFGDAVGLRITPEYEVEAREKFSEVKELKTIGLGSLDDMTQMFYNLMNSKVSFSEMDKRDLLDFMVEYPDAFVQGIPTDIRIKENFATIFGMVAETEYRDQLVDKIRTATDVLRLAVVLSNGDVSLAEKTDFKKFKRADRRFLLESLDNLPLAQAKEDMNRHREAWVRLGEILHPGEYAKRYTRAFEAFKAIREKEKFDTFNRKLEKFMAEGNVREARHLLHGRPGEFARRLNWLLKGQPSATARGVVSEFAKVAENVPVSTLLQVRAYFADLALNKTNLRAVLPKSGVGKIDVRVLEEKDRVDPSVAQFVVSACTRAIEDRLSREDRLGKVYIDPAIRGIAVPLGLRSASESLNYVGRGSRFDIPEGDDTLRFFIHWTDMETGYGRVDVDLSAFYMDENFKHIGQISYYSLRGNGGYHSGDITSAPDGATEFIDINMKQTSARYIAMTVYSYTGQNFSDIPECFAGFMSRSKPNSGEIYEPASVHNKVDLTVPTTRAIPYIFDIKERKAIWLDMAEYTPYGGVNNIANGATELQLAMEAIVNRTVSDLYDLFYLHATTRGTLVETREEADVVIAVDGDVSPFDTAKINSDWLS